MNYEQEYIAVQGVNASLFFLIFFFSAFLLCLKNIIFYLLGVVYNDMQIDRMLLRVPSRAIPGSVKASLSLTGW